MSTFNNALIDNSCDELRLVNILSRMISSHEFNYIRIATGYWDLPGMKLIYDQLKDFLAEGGHLDIMIGKEPQLRPYQLRDDLSDEEKQFPKFQIKRDIDKLSDEYIDVARLLLKYCEIEDESNSPIQIRVYGQQKDHEEFLHAKCYIFLNNGEKRDANGIVGSSNFTQKGLEENAELNYLETNPTIITAVPNEYSPAKGHNHWFQEKWDESEPWNGEFIMEILKNSPVGKKAAEGNDNKGDLSNDEPEVEPFTPYEQYIKLLQIQFGDVVDKKLGEQIEAYLPQKVHKLKYQIEAVKRCLSIMHEHGGFMLADVVGLGKTIIGILIIKRFLTVPEDDGRERKVLVITPPAIQRGWLKTLEMFDKDNDDKISPLIDFITTGRVGNMNDIDEDDDDDEMDSGDFDGMLQYKNYGLIIIDESHKFRNSNTIMYQALDELIQNIASEMGQAPYIGLLSATPQNNRPDDLKNQIYLFERNHIDSTLKKAESGNIERFFANIGSEYALLINNQNEIPEVERQERLNAISKQIRDCILADILERRTRTDVKTYYENDMKEQGLVFPQICGPHCLEYKMDDELAELFADSMTMIAPTEIEKLAGVDYLHYYRYRAIEYFVDENNKKKHSGRGNREVEDVAKQLANIMRMLLVKRLESSFAAFSKSLLNLRQYTENMKLMWENNTIFVCPQIDVNTELNIEEKTKKRGKKVTFADCVEDIRAKIKKLTEEGRNTRGQNAEYTRQDFKEEYYDLLKEDLRLISKLYDRWSLNYADPKFDCFKDAITPVLFNPKTNTAGKLVIFSEAIDTVNTLASAVKAKGHRPLVVTAANRKDMEPVIEKNFDANYEGEPANDYDVIITTEVLAEGVNLHRANVILNYDTPWNSTRLMQRIGRVNRVGSKEPFVHIYNFMPSAQGDKQIKLVRKAHTKLQSFHILFGEDSKIFSDDEKVVNYAIQHAIDGEESPMEKYIYELKQYKYAHPERYNQIESVNEDWQIVSSQTGDAFFLVKAPRSARLAIRVTQGDTLQPKIISIIEMLEDAKPEVDAIQTEHPDKWDSMIELVKDAYSQYFVQIVNSRAGEKRTKALKVIHDLLHHSQVSAKAKKLLGNARKLADKGSYDIIRKMIVIDVKLQEKNSLFPLTQEDIEDTLEKEIGKLVANVETKQGEGEILIGTIR